MNMMNFLATLATEISTKGIPKLNADPARLQTFLSVIFGLLGAVSLLVLVIAGLRYVNSAGDPGTMSKTKNTIIYAAVGLIVSMSAYAMVAFVLSNV
jgi:hypothetical protein